MTKEQLELVRSLIRHGLWISPTAKVDPRWRTWIVMQETAEKLEALLNEEKEERRAL